ncbi:hypothetical protein QBC34DRAFT_28367 [Podospora aff. communis PSN243]|uniref:Uncharacterized protein n=1 Tax=Podospora aff. communis PSN243 TaxID=3040156 RepID=A0AAV9GXN1_9PEZI|nr:hypothetical protein QBC34DRAFT_28367 [Podospora aff. communis PSN243]
MGIEDILLNMDMGWTDTAYHHPQPHRTQFCVNNITALSSLVATPTPLLQRRAMDSLAQSVPFLDTFRRWGFLAFERVSSILLKQLGRLSSRWQRPIFLMWVLILGMKTLVMDMWLGIYLAQHYQEDRGQIEWRAVWRDTRRSIRTNACWLVTYTLFPAWVIVGYVVTALKFFELSWLGWSPSESTLVQLMMSGSTILGLWLASTDEFDETGNERALDGENDGSQSTGDESKAPGKGAGGLKKKPRRKQAKKKKNSHTFR